MNKAQKVHHLATNCGCWKGRQAELERMEEGTLDVLIKNDKDAKDAHTLATNAVKPIVTADGKTYVFNKDKGEWELQAPPPASPAVTTNAQQPLTLAQMLERASPEEKAAWNQMVTTFNDAKTALVTRIALAKPEAERAAFTAKLNAMDIGVLKDMASLLPAENQPSSVLMPFAPGFASDPPPNFSGQAGAPVHNAGRDGMPEYSPVTINWDEDAYVPATKRRQETN